MVYEDQDQGKAKGKRSGLIIRRPRPSPTDLRVASRVSLGARCSSSAAPRSRLSVRPFGVPSDWALGMAQGVARGARFPPLILVTTGPGGDLVVLEGHARLTAFMLARDRLPPELEVLVGSSPAMPR